MSARVVVAGLGPAGPDLVTTAVREHLAGADGPVFFRTSRHPSAADILRQLPAARTFDHLYESHASFEALYLAIAHALVDEAARREGTVTYAVPGSPLVAERSVVLLREVARSTGVLVEMLGGFRSATSSGRGSGSTPWPRGCALSTPRPLPPGRRGRPGRSSSPSAGAGGCSRT